LDAGELEIANRFRTALEIAGMAGDWTSGQGQAAVQVHQVYKVKDSGDFAYERDLRIEITIRNGKIGRYEIRTVG